MIAWSLNRRFVCLGWSIPHDAIGPADEQCALVAGLAPITPGAAWHSEAPGNEIEGSCVARIVYGTAHA